MGKSGFTGIGAAKHTLTARALSLALCIGLAGCGSPAARQPRIAHTPVGAHLVHTALTDQQPVMWCEQLITAASFEQADPGWDEATIELIRSSLGYTSR